MDERVPGSRATAEGDPIVGRDAEADRLSALAAGASGGGRVLLLSGAAGMGKSTLLEYAAGRAEEAGRRVLRASGRESERDLAFAGLHQLLRPVLDEAARLPDRQHRALLGAFGFVSDSPDPLLTGVAVLTLLSQVAERAPLLVVLDDAQWLDAASADVLAFAARRLDDDPITVLAAVRDGDPVTVPAAGRDGGPGFDRGFPTLVLGPLDDAAARRLLGLRWPGLTGRIRDRVLGQAAGNPLALLELARHAPPDPDDHGPLPVGERLAAAYAARLAELPEAGRQALVLLAAADAEDPPDAVLALLPDAGDKAWAAVEESGLIRRAGRHVRFRHPLVRSAIYHAAPFDARMNAHRALAGALRDEPDRRAWHLAATALHPDAEVSAALERTAGRARRRGGYAAAAKALARAAELRPGRDDGARLLADAAGLAVYTGDLSWVEELAGRARARTDDPAVLATASLHVGRLAALTGQHTAGFGELAAIAGDLAATHPAIALDALAAAAVLRFYSGEESQRQEIDRLLPRLPAGPLREWARIVSDPFGGGRELAPRLPGLIAEIARAGAGGRPERLTALAIAAWVLDETPLAVRTFDEAVQSWRSAGPLPDGLGGVVALACFEYGRWDRAREVCAELGALPAASRLHHAVACAHAIEALIVASQGDTAAARTLADGALRLVDPLESRSVAVYAHRALTAAALAEGDYEAAYQHLRMIFGAGGDPVHYHASYPALPDLAESAARTGHHAEAIGIVERAAQVLARGGSPRLCGLVHRSRALLAEPEHAEPGFLAGLAAPALERWPFERAQAQLEYAEWLRRRRRIAEARPFLTAAYDTFRRLGARPWSERAQAELRAAGLDVDAATPGALSGLSPQQQQIVRLAARGLTNREIGERLFLSPRTVGSHLYRTFPKLGVTARSQLRDVVEAAAADG
ncbi:helix-turn-helix transcriptional regulator [Nonomuraea rubra]|uniref:DNA-binding CsgD family transcriptional regulator n=1 Tax=Nonomuraea rubra TaxID=46180 RepID=A0A7X0U1R8_9ACTN|nr:LuxR family transcriptional regulator [Nonomuraea rubra]MBB6551670.1 DNA-binding CsgD family transcriptional regulator [Nonomuraea rubra]